MASENGEQSPAIITIVKLISIALTTRTLQSHAICSASSEYYVQSIFTRMARHTIKCGAGRICGADLNGDNLQIFRAYLRISDHCRVTVRARVTVMVRVWITVLVRVRVRVTDCCILLAVFSSNLLAICLVCEARQKVARNFFLPIFKQM